jgi:hypothetical protein
MLFAVPLLLAAAPLPLKTPEELDAVTLQGRWVLKTTEYLGEKANQDPTECPVERRLLKLRLRTAEERELPEDFKKYRTTLEIKGNTYDYRQWVVPFNGGKGEVRSQKGTYKLDAKRSLRVMARLELGEPQPRTVHYTYQVRGDTLKMGLHFSNDRKKLPKTFTTDKDEDVVVLTFRREKK